MDINKRKLEKLRSNSFAIAIDAHTAGEPIRVIFAGYSGKLEEKGSMVDRQKWIKKHDDEFRTRTMQEPRGHAAMFGAIVMEPVSSEADVGVLFPYPAGYADMCGHGAIGVANVLVELGLVEATEGKNRITLDTPAGLVQTIAHLRNGSVREVDLLGTPSYFVDTVAIDLNSKGRVHVALSYGGNFFGIVKVEELDLPLKSEYLDELNELAHEIMHSINCRNDIRLKHPTTGELSLERIRFVEGEKSEKNVVIHEGAVIDRSPCGTGTCSQIAWEYYNGKTGIDDSKVYRSIIDTEFRGEAIEEKEFKGKQAIIPKVTGSSYITGLNYFLVSNNDPLVDGFTI